MGSRRRRWLNQSIYSSVASSTASQVFHEARRWMTSAFEFETVLNALDALLEVRLPR